MIKFNPFTGNFDFLGSGGASLPDQTGNSGKFLTTDGSDASWAIVSGSGAVDSVNGQTGTVVLDADDISDTSTTNKYVTAADVTKLSNLSGTNTGDQDLTDYFDKTLDDLDDITEGTTNKIFTATLKTKLDGVEAQADVTDATNVDASGAVMNSDTSTASMSFVIDEDNMTSDSATKVPTQQSVKAYVDANTGGGGSGDVTGPGSSTDNEIVVFNSTTGKVIKSSGGTTLSSGAIYNSSGASLSASALSEVSIMSGTTKIAVNEDNAPNAASINSGLSMNSNKIVNVTDPTNAQDAATKAYVDLVPDGDVVGPSSTTNNTLVAWDGTTGKLVKDSGLFWNAGGSLNLGVIASINGTDMGDFVYRMDTQTLTNKRITKRSSTTAGPGATPTINTDNLDYVDFTALATAITSMTTNLSGTPTRGQTLWISFTDNGTARAITWGSGFESSTVALPTTTVLSTRLDVGFIWNTVTSKWRCVGVA